uniref:Phytocyanin domain-containing protein n=1 Tax=Chenopodium quinoa TaxID=63459 RepID=A0A803LNV1_CHEQI
MNTVNSSVCILVITILGASLLGTCMANKEEKPLTTQRWGWGWGWGRGQDTPPAPPEGRGWVWGRGQETPPAPPEGRGWGWGWGRGESPAPAGTPRGQAESPPPAGTPQGDCPFSKRNRTDGPNKIVVGGSNNWNFGFNYSDWALKNGPFYVNDVLVFKFNAPVNGAPGHSVYLLPDLQSYLSCDLSRGKRVATTTQGGGSGFEFKLTKWQPHYFACGEHNGIHCNLGMMKFSVMPIFHYWN